MSGHLYNSTIGKVSWFIRRFGASEVALKPLRLAFGRWILPRLHPQTFPFQGRTYLCHFALYNMTWVGERMVELPIAEELLKQHRTCRVLEVGNVLSHYYKCDHVIVDKFEKGAGVINVDILDYKDPEPFDLVISVSTFEHIGFDDESPTSSGIRILAAIKHCRQLLTKDGRLIITFPTGYNPELDELLRSGGLGASQLHFLVRTGVRKWKGCDLSTALSSPYRSRFPYGNAVVIAEFGAIGR